jgi:hypothetical protein
MWCNTVPFRVDDLSIKWRIRGWRLDGGEDVGLRVRVGHVLVLHEAIEAVDFELQPLKLLPQIGTPSLCLGASHLQRDESLLDLLLRINDSVL